MPKRYRYTVRGRGRFPLDMLRYDCAWPMSQADVSSIERSRDYQGIGNPERSIALYSHKKPTDARWSSFGWATYGLEQV